MSRSRNSRLYPGLGFHSEMEPNPRVEVVLAREYLDAINDHLQETQGYDLIDLAIELPHDAYRLIRRVAYQIGGAASQLISDGGKILVSEAEDGSAAIHGLVRHGIDSFPDPDVVPVEVMVSVFDQPGWLDRLRGTSPTIIPVVDFETEPPSLAF